MRPIANTLHVTVFDWIPMDVVYAALEVIFVAYCVFPESSLPDRAFPLSAAGAIADTFGSTSHGAGRVLSRKAARKQSRGRAIGRELEDKGILVRWTGRHTMAEEMPDAYKDISRVVGVVHGAGISRKVAKLRPIAVVKG